MDATIHAAVGDLYCSTAEAAEFARLQHLIWVLTGNRERDIVCAKIPAGGRIRQ